MDEPIKDLSKEVRQLNETIQSLETKIEEQSDPTCFPTLGTVIKELVVSINALRETIEKKL